MEIIRTEALFKHFGTTPAIDGISIQVNKGEIYGFLGLNGAGKTTLIRMLLGMIKPDSGSVQLFGKEVSPRYQTWNEVGYLVETPNAYPNLTVAENLKVYYELRQLQNPDCIGAIINRLKLTKYKDKEAKVLSLGNQQRLGLAKALMHHPKLLILDEPINGLDPEGIVEVRTLLQELAEKGTTIFLSSHILGEIAKVANRIGIIHNGKLLKELTTLQLQEQLTKKLSIQTPDNQKALACLSAAKYHVKLTPENMIEIKDAYAIAHPENISRILVESGCPPRQLAVYTEDLEMYFLRIIRS